MTVADHAWLERNLGFDPLRTKVPEEAFAVRRAAGVEPHPEDLQRELIDFDSEAPEGRAFLAFGRATGMSRFTDIPWPSGLEPRTGPGPTGRTGSPLPHADVLVVTWTMDEGHALSRVLTPGKDSRDDYRPYTHNYPALSRKMRAGCPAKELKRLGAYWTTRIGGVRTLVFKCDSHMSQDGPELPNRDVWRQILEEVKPRLVLTTGTAGGIGADFEVGDVIVSSVVRFDCTSKFKREPFAQAHYSSAQAKTARLDTAHQLFSANAGQLPPDNHRAPKIVVVAPTELTTAVVTTDFFGFDTTDNHYKLEGLGDVSEMGDAVLGLVCSELGANAPPWLCVRNVSDPQINDDGIKITQAGKVAADIYKAFGRWSSVCSAITCWALIAAEQG